MFKTTMTEEYKSDIYGERGILLGAVHAIIEGLFRRYIKQGMTPEEAFINSSESITGPITKKISTQGILKVRAHPLLLIPLSLLSVHSCHCPPSSLPLPRPQVYEDLSAADKAVFEKAYSAAYVPAREILEEMYDEVASGNEIRSVIMAGSR